MAGSLRAFDYVADDAATYKIFRDESNTEALNTGAPAAGANPNLPRLWETRYALMYQVSNPQIKRKVSILTPEQFALLDGSTSYSLQVVGAANEAFRISALIGERRLGLTNVDTGQTDGDGEGIVVT